MQPGLRWYPRLWVPYRRFYIAIILQLDCDRKAAVWWQGREGGLEGAKAGEGSAELLGEIGGGWSREALLFCGILGLFRVVCGGGLILSVGRGSGLIRGRVCEGSQVVGGRDAGKGGCGEEIAL